MKMKYGVLVPLNRFMTRTKAALLSAQAKKNPELQCLIDNVNDFSMDDINNLNQPKWIKEGLIVLKSLANYKSFEEYVLAHCIDGFNEDFKGNIVKYIGEETFMKFGRTELLIKTNDLLFITEKGVWRDSAFTSQPDSRLSNFVSIKIGSFTEYKKEVQHSICLRYGLKDEGDKIESRKGIITNSYFGEYPPT